MKGNIVRLYDADPTERLDIELELTQELHGLEKHVFYLFGIKRSVPKLNGNQKTEIVLTTLYMSRSKSPKIIKDKVSKMLFPALLCEGLLREIIMCHGNYEKDPAFAVSLRENRSKDCDWGD